MLYLALGGGLSGVGALTGVLWYYGRDLPNFDRVEDYAPPQMTRLYAQEGDELGALYRARRTVVPQDKIAPVMVKALLAAEDADFYQHEGLDYWGMLRALYNSVRAGRLKGSGSTITQQTVKNILLTQEKTLARKVKEVLLTRRLEERFSKDEILNMYLNTIYFGHGREGVEEAARFYFGKPAIELELHEAATIAGLIQSPERHTPRRHPESALKRRAYVLRQMASKGMITEGERDVALALPLSLAPRPTPHLESAQWWVREARKALVERLGEERVLTGGLQVEGTLSLHLQRAAHNALQEGLRALDNRQRLNRPLKHLKTPSARQAWLTKRNKRLKGEPPKRGARLKALVTEVQQDKRGRHEVVVSFGAGRARLSPYSVARLKRSPEVGDLFNVKVIERAEGSEGLMRAELELPQAAFVALNPHTREVVALVGGWRFKQSPFNRVTQARRQPGSAFKPFVYGAALESRRFTLTTPLLDAPETWSLGGGQRWTPQNYNRRFIGPVSFKRALAKSINSTAVRLADSVGLERVQEFAKRAGLKSELINNLTLALGSSELSPLELVNAYATLLTGRRAEPRFVRAVSSPKGEALWPLPPHAEVAFSEDLSWLMNRLLRAVVTEGSGRRLRVIQGEVVGKTGTSNEGKDAWFVGGTPQLIFAVWVGYDHPKPLGRREAGGGTAAPIALSFLKEAIKGGHLEVGAWPEQPEGVVRRRVDLHSNLLARDDDEQAVEGYFLKGTEPTTLAPQRAEGGGESEGLFGLGEEEE
jgi:penicillin-binding protein 1A